MKGSSERSEQVAQHIDYTAADDDGRVVTDQDELHDQYADDERFVTEQKEMGSGPVSHEFQFPDQA